MKKCMVLALSLGVLTLGGCSSMDSMGEFWLTEQSTHTDAPDPAVDVKAYAPSDDIVELNHHRSRFTYTPDSRDREYHVEEAVEPGYKDPLYQGFFPSQTHKRLNDYASQLAMELMDNATGLTQQDKVGIASFVRLNTSLQDSTVLGNQLAEYLITELQDFGLAVVDFKLAGSISVTPVGDFVLTRQAIALAEQVAMDHVVTGTIIEEDRGVRVNARIVSLTDKQVVASAHVYIPAFIVVDLNHTAKTSSY